MARQKSSKPTNKVIAAVLAAPIAQYVLPIIGVSGDPLIESGVLALVVGVVGYLVPPSLTDQVEEYLPENRRSNA